MSRFFQLRDELPIPGRWHLGEIVERNGLEPMLAEAVCFNGSEPLLAKVTKPGVKLEFTMNSFNVPVANARLAHCIELIAGSDVECIPVQIIEGDIYKVLNSKRVVECLDELSSEYIKWTELDHRSDLAGQYRQVTKLCLDRTKIPQDAHFFRISGWLVALVVSEQIKDMMEKTGCFGAKFQEVQ